MTSGAGFLLSGLFVTGEDTPIIGITNSKGPINLIDVHAASNSATSGTLAININNHNGAINLNRVEASQSPVSGGALLANLLGKAGITITSSTFDKNGTGASSGLFIASNGPVTINGSSISKNRSPDLPGLSIFQSGTLTIKNTDISGNYHSGMLTEPLKSNITLEDVYFIENRRTGVGLTTSGSITLKNVTASENYYEGALIDTCWVSAGVCTATGTGKVTITSSKFDENENQNSLTDAGALWIISRGAISLKDISAVYNGSPTFPISGAILDTSYSPLVSGVSISKGAFDGNRESGLLVYAKGAITLTSVSAYGNSTAYGAYLDNSLGTSGVTIKGLSTVYNNFSTNGDTLGSNDDGLHIATKGSINLNYLYVNSNRGNGLLFVGTGSSNVSIKYGDFTYNDEYGLIISTGGTISLNNVSASFNNQTGVTLENYTSLTPKNVTVSSSTFSYNDYEGIVVNSKGLVTFSKVISIGNVMGCGISIDNSYGSAGVTVLYSSSMDNNDEGLDITSKGAIKLTNFTSTSNGSGAFLNNLPSSTQQPVTISGGLFNESNSFGLVIASQGNISVSKIFVYDNLFYGANMGNFGSSAFPTIKVSLSNFESNGGFGLVVRARGSITLTSVGASGNAGTGADLENESGNVSVLVSGKNENYFNFNTGSHDGLRINTTGAVILKKVNATDNSGAEGVNIGFDKLPGSVSITGGNVSFNDEGLIVYSKGAVTVSGLNAQGNTHHAININNAYDTTGTKPVAVNKGVYFDNETGVEIHTYGQITLSSIISNGNDIGASLINSYPATSPKGITITGSTNTSNQFSNNTWGGIFARSCGPITITGVTADSNGDNGIDLNQSSTPNGGGNITLNKVTARYNAFRNISVDTNGTFKGSNILSMFAGMEDGLTLYVHDHAVTISNSIFIGNEFFGIYAVMGTGSVAPFTLTNVFAAGNDAGQIFVAR